MLSKLIWKPGVEVNIVLEVVKSNQALKKNTEKEEEVRRDRGNGVSRE